MIISPDSFIYDEHGIYVWTPKAAKEAWRLAEKALKDACASKLYSTLALMSGPPGAGKSTYISRMGQEDWIYFDATLCAPKKRKHILNLVKEFSLKKVCVYVDTPIDVCLTRNAQRSPDRKVPEGTIQQMYANLQTPTKEEGFDQIITIKHHTITKATTSIKGKYFALVLTKESQKELLEKIPPIHTSLFASHVTLFYGPSAETITKCEHLIGEIGTIKCLSSFQDEFGQCISVEIPSKLILSKDQVHHITISCAPGTPPVYSKKLLKKEGVNIHESFNLIGKFELL